MADMHIPKLQTDRSREGPEMESSFPFTEPLALLNYPSSALRSQDTISASSAGIISDMDF